MQSTHFLYIYVITSASIDFLFHQINYDFPAMMLQLLSTATTQTHSNKMEMSALYSQ